MPIPGGFFVDKNLEICLKIVRGGKTADNFPRAQPALLFASIPRKR